MARTIGFQLPTTHKENLIPIKNREKGCSKPIDVLGSEEDPKTTSDKMASNKIADIYMVEQYVQANEQIKELNKVEPSFGLEEIVSTYLKLYLPIVKARVTLQLKYALEIDCYNVFVHTLQKITGMSKRAIKLGLVYSNINQIISEQINIILKQLIEKYLLINIQKREQKLMRFMMNQDIAIFDAFNCINAWFHQKTLTNVFNNYKFNILCHLMNVKHMAITWANVSTNYNTLLKYNISEQLSGNRLTVISLPAVVYRDEPKLNIFNISELKQQLNTSRRITVFDIDKLQKNRNVINSKHVMLADMLVEPLFPTTTTKPKAIPKTKSITKSKTKQKAKLTAIKRERGKDVSIGLSSKPLVDMFLSELIVSETSSSSAPSPVSRLGSLSSFKSLRDDKTDNPIKPAKRTRIDATISS